MTSGSWSAIQLVDLVFPSYFTVVYLQYYVCCFRDKSHWVYWYIRPSRFLSDFKLLWDFNLSVVELLKIQRTPPHPHYLRTGELKETLWISKSRRRHSGDSSFPRRPLPHLSLMGCSPTSLHSKYISNFFPYYFSPLCIVCGITISSNFAAHCFTLKLIYCIFLIGMH